MEKTNRVGDTFCPHLSVVVDNERLSIMDYYPEDDYDGIITYSSDTKSDRLIGGGLVPQKKGRPRSMFLLGHMIGKSLRVKMLKRCKQTVNLHKTEIDENYIKTQFHAETPLWRSVYYLFNRKQYRWDKECFRDGCLFSVFDDEYHRVVIKEKFGEPRGRKHCWYTNALGADNYYFAYEDEPSGYPHCIPFGIAMCDGLVTRYGWCQKNLHGDDWVAWRGAIRFRYPEDRTLCLIAT